MRKAVAVRPYALQWLEQYAMAEELRRIEAVGANPQYDPLVE